MLRYGLVLLLALSAHAQGDATCMDSPNREMCKNADDFYPDSKVTMDLGMLCTAMPHMPGCAVKACCDSATCTGVAAKYCEPWSLLKDICGVQTGEMMTGMMGCANFNKLCGKDVATMVGQCTESSSPFIPSLPTTMKSLSAGVTVCGVKPPVTSAWCTDNPCTTTDAPNCKNPFTTLSDACKMDSNKDGCATSGWTAMCTADGGNLQKYCGSSYTTKNDDSTMTVGAASRLSSSASLVALVVTAFAVVARV